MGSQIFLPKSIQLTSIVSEIINDNCFMEKPIARSENRLFHVFEHLSKPFGLTP